MTHDPQHDAPAVRRAERAAEVVDLITAAFSGVPDYVAEFTTAGNGLSIELDVDPRDSDAMILYSLEAALAQVLARFSEKVAEFRAKDQERLARVGIAEFRKSRKDVV